MPKKVEKKENDINNVNNETKKEPKKRAPKKKPTKEEGLKMLLDTSNELKQIINDLKEDEIKLCQMHFKRVPDLVKETIKNLEEDLIELDERYKELSLMDEQK